MARKLHEEKARDICQPYLDQNRTVDANGIVKGWNIFKARDDLMENEPIDLIGRVFGPANVLHVMRQMTTKGKTDGHGADNGPKTKRYQEQLSLAFQYFDVDPAHTFEEKTDDGVVLRSEIILTDEMSEEEFTKVIDSCAGKINDDIEANSKRARMRDELGPIFRQFPDVITIKQAIEKRIELRQR